MPNSMIGTSIGDQARIPHRETAQREMSRRRAFAFSFDARFMASTENSTPAGADRPQDWLPIAALVALFVAALVLFTQHNRYPYFYHPDEYGKSKQIVEGKRNSITRCFCSTSRSRSKSLRAKRPLIEAGEIAKGRGRRPAEPRRFSRR
jgi:hypothetical protein